MTRIMIDTTAHTATTPSRILQASQAIWKSPVKSRFKNKTTENLDSAKAMINRQLLANTLCMDPVSQPDPA